MKEIDEKTKKEVNERIEDDKQKLNEIIAEADLKTEHVMCLYAVFNDLVDALQTIVNDN